MKAKQIIEPLKSQDAKALRAKAQELKHTDGEGWAIGEVLERYLGAVDEEVYPSFPNWLKALIRRFNCLLFIIKTRFKRRGTKK